MSIEATRSVIERYELGRGDVIAPDAIYTNLATGEETRGADEIRTMLRHVYSEAFDADLERTHFIVGDGQAVQAGFIVGTHTGEYAGVAATGKQVRIPLAVVYEVSDDMIQRAWIHFGLYSFLKQVGALPS